MIANDQSLKCSGENSFERVSPQFVGFCRHSSRSSPPVAQNHIFRYHLHASGCTKPFFFLVPQITRHHQTLMWFCSCLIYSPLLVTLVMSQFPIQFAYLKLPFAVIHACCCCITRWSCDLRRKALRCQCVRKLIQSI